MFAFADKKGGKTLRRFGAEAVDERKAGKRASLQKEKEEKGLLLYHTPSYTEGKKKEPANH